MITASQIESALSLTGVTLYTNAETQWITANEPVTDEMQAKVRKWWAAGEVNSYPPEVGSFQIRAALVAKGWVTITNADNPDADLDAWALGLINTYVSDPAKRIIARMAWHNASGFKFTNEFIVLISAVLGKTEEDRKELFRTADTF
jgi:hypothetical protein